MASSAITAQADGLGRVPTDGVPWGIAAHGVVLPRRRGKGWVGVHIHASAKK